MIVIIIDNICVSIDEPKEYPPIAGYFDCMKAFFITTQLVKERTWIIHIFYFCCRIKTVKYYREPICMFWSNTLLTACIIKVF